MTTHLEILIPRAGRPTLRDLLETELKVQRPEAINGIGRYHLDRVAFVSQPGEAEGALGRSCEAQSPCPVVDRWCVDVEHPALAALG